MRIAAAQIDIELGQLKRNLEKIERWIHKAGAEGIDLIVFPECALCGYCFESRAEALPHAIGIDDPCWQNISRCLMQAGVQAAAIGYLERDGDRLYNALALVTESGVVGGYRKIHLPHLGIDRFVDRGNRPYAVHEVGGMKIGLAICYDCSFPEPMRVLGLLRADVIALATNWPMAAQQTARIVPAARSMENHLFFVAANRIGQERAFSFCGLSSIWGPDGIQLARASDHDEQLISAAIDLGVARNKRIERTKGAHVIDRFADRRPEFYGPILDPIPPEPEQN